MKYIGYIFLIVFISIIGCQEEGRIDNIDSDGPPPQQLSNITIKSTPGGAVLHYDLPNDDEFLYALVTYEAAAGVTREAKASLYVDSLVLVGYADTLQHTIEIVTVGKNAKISEPIIKTFAPLKAPVHSALGDVELTASFGGIVIRTKNPNEANLIFNVVQDTVGDGEWLPLGKFYTNQMENKFVIRGLPAETSNFGVFVTDRWGNKSNQLDKTLTPLFEIQIPTLNFKDIKLPNDSPTLRPQNPLSHLWNGKWSHSEDFWASDQNITPLPKWVSIDFGAKYKLSRLQAWQRRDYAYDGRFPDKWEVYGSNDPNPDGSWDSWTKMAAFGPPYKPSGLPGRAVTAEDIEFAENVGHDYEFEELPEAYQYYRLKFLESSSGEEFILISEIEFYGQPAE